MHDKSVSTQLFLSINSRLPAWSRKGLFGPERFEERAEGEDLKERTKEPLSTKFGKLNFHTVTEKFDYEFRVGKKYL